MFSQYPPKGHDVPKFSLPWLNRVASAWATRGVRSDNTPYTNFPFRHGGIVEVMPKIGAVIVRWKRGAIDYNRLDIDREHPALKRPVYAIVENSALDGEPTWPRSLKGRVDNSGGATVLDYPGGWQALLKSLIRAVDAYTIGMRKGDTLVFNFEPNHGFITSLWQITRYLGLEDLAEIMASLKRYADENSMSETEAAETLEAFWSEIFRKLVAHVHRLGFKAGIYAPGRMVRVHSDLFDVRVVPAYCRNDDGNGNTDFASIERSLENEFRTAAVRDKRVMVVIIANCVSPHSRAGRQMSKRDMVGVSNAIINAANTYKLRSDPEVRIWTGPSKSDISRADRVIRIYGELTGGILGEDPVGNIARPYKKKTKKSSK